MTSIADPDPFEQGQRAARENIPAEGNPYQDGTEQHALWAAGHEQAAGSAEADEAQRGVQRQMNQRGPETAQPQPIFFRPLLNRGPLSA